MATKPEYFSCETTPLKPGINLIEASAGTGKTYAIAMLVLRFIIEHDLKIEELLIVTFTKAATDELKARIRSRLSQAKRALAGNIEGLDGSLLNWIDNLEVDPEQAKNRLQLALLDIDQAGIFTIHGFCQRVLSEHALESGQLFDCELSGDISAPQQQIADDYWREQVYPLNVRHAALITAVYQTPEQLLSSVVAIKADDHICPEDLDLEPLLQTIDRMIETAKGCFENNKTKLEQVRVDGNLKPILCQQFDDLHQQLKNWLEGQTFALPPADALILYSADGLMQALNGQKFRKTKTQSSADRKLDYLQKLGFETEAYDQLNKTLKSLTLAFRLGLAKVLRNTLSEHLQQLNMLSFDDLIHRLANALKSEKGLLLKSELRHRFQAALIDEFQDTDNRQWFIFSSLFATDSHFLFLIGDPKQAIYKFRGADIYTYFAAQQMARYRYTLGKNWRSHPLLVDAVNTLFTLYRDEQQPFLDERLPYTHVQAAKTSADGSLLKNGEEQPPMVMMQLPQSDKNGGYWSAGVAGTELRTAVVNEILQLLDPDDKTIIHDSNNDKQRRLQPEDIAILVRTNSQAAAYQATLHQAGIPSVLNCTDSIFATEEAANLYILLQAIAHPGDIELLKQALTLSWFDLDGPTLAKIIDDESAIEVWLTRFQDGYQHWQSKGLMAMMLEFMKTGHIQFQRSNGINPERQLTNLLHLLELLQQATMDEHLGINKTLGWLHTALSQPETTDDQQLRLESDAAAVNIITLHRAKGLEYPVVFCPYLWSPNDKLQGGKELVKCHDRELDCIVADLGSDQFGQHRQQALREQQAEDMRLLYVALTRAKYRCYVAWADVRTKSTANSSALSHLLFAGQEQTFAEQQAFFNALSHNYPALFQHRLIPVPTLLEGRLQASTQQQTLSARQRTRRLSSSWQMSSYSALSVLSQQSTPELPLDKAQEHLFSEAEVQPADPIPKGAHTGNALHELLEKIPFKDLAEGRDISTLRNQTCQRYGVHLEQPELIDTLLKNVVTTPLARQNRFTLADLDESQCLKEMPFYLSMAPINTLRINTVLKNSPDFQPLSNKQMRGYLTGFIDLICCYQNRYYVIDYKSNALPDYQNTHLTQAMKEHNYGLQYWIYTLVLHRYLQNRLPDYHYEHHFGGVRYLFMRGMRPGQALSGVYQAMPDLQHVEQLATLFGG